MQHSPQVTSLLTSPVLPSEEKKRALRDTVGRRAHPLLLDFLSLMVDKRRVGLLPAVADSYHRLVNDHRKVVEAEVASAVPLRPEEEQLLTRLLERRTGRKVVLRKRVDRTLLGGLAIHYNDTVIEGSVRSHLRALYGQLLTVRVPGASLAAD